MPPHGRDLPLPLLDAQPDDAALARAGCVVGFELFVTDCDLGGLDSVLGLFITILCPLRGRPPEGYLGRCQYRAILADANIGLAWPSRQMPI